jgi:hypothetical protein
VWTTTEAVGPSTNLVAIKATDNSAWAVSSTQTFAVVVNELNVAPALSTIAARTVNEGTSLTITNLATDADLPANRLTFTLLSAPTNAVLDPNTGVLAWTPTETQGPGTNRVRVRVADNGSPNMEATGEFTVTVREVNAPPVWRSDPPAVAPVGQIYSYRLDAIDSENELLRFTAVTLPTWLSLQCAGTPIGTRARLASFSHTVAPGLTVNRCLAAPDWTPLPGYDDACLPEPKYYEGEGWVYPTVKSQTLEVNAPPRSRPGHLMSGGSVVVNPLANRFPDVALYLTVLDQSGNPVTGLPQSAFAVWEQSGLENQPTAEAIHEFSESDGTGAGSRFRLCSMSAAAWSGHPSRTRRPPPSSSSPTLRRAIAAIWSSSNPRRSWYCPRIG